MLEENERPVFPKRAIVTAGMPYGNKGLHFGHIAGVFVPADAYARFLRDRIGADNVMFVSGTDCYGSPILENYRKLHESGEFEGTIEDFVTVNHEKQKVALDAYEISLDIYEGSGLGTCKDIHRQVTDEFIRRLYDNGFLEMRKTAQFYDEKAQMFLNGRQVVGHCPVQGCKSEKAYADECDLGHQFMPEDLIAPKSTVTGETPTMRDVGNWYFKLPDFMDIIDDYVADTEGRRTSRPVVANTIREFLVPPVIYIKNELLEDFQVCAAKLPEHVYRPAEEGKTSFEVEFESVAARDDARQILSDAGIRYRTGKALVPLRITGNIEWGVPAPHLADEEPLTVWCWPESLWAPISFSKACLVEHGHDAAESVDWWCSDDARVYQFIGQDNIYFYGVAQPALWAATQTGHAPQAQGVGDELRETELIANYHVLFMNRKASSSSAVKPPMAADLLEHYTAEQLRAHFLALNLAQKSVSFAPKAFDPDATEKAGDPVLKEGALLTNVFNRIARSCFYSAQRESGVTVDNDKNGTVANGAQSYMPLGNIDQEVVDRANRAILDYEHFMSRVELHRVMMLVDEYLRGVQKYWNDNKDAEGERGRQVLLDTFFMLRVATVLMHPIAPGGCEMICDYLGFGNERFFSWEYVFCGYEALCHQNELDEGRHPIRTLLPRVDFFGKHPSQYGK